jgi:hypothetical protein
MHMAKEPLEETFFTQKEVEFLLALKEYRQLKMTAVKLGISYRRASAIKANIQKKWKKGVNSNNYILGLTRRDEGFKKLMLSAGRSTLPIEEEELWQ